MNAVNFGGDLSTRCCDDGDVHRVNKTFYLYNNILFEERYADDDNINISRQFPRISVLPNNNNSVLYTAQSVRMIVHEHCSRLLPRQYHIILKSAGS